MSENHNISSLFDRSGNLTLEAIERYLGGLLSMEEKTIVERHLETSPFEREALEGLKNQPTGILQKELGDLNARIMAKASEKAAIPKPRSVRPYYWAAAAGLLGLVGLTVVLVFMFRSPSEQQLAVNGQRSAVSTQDSGTWVNQQSTVGSQQSEVRNSESGIRNPESGIRNGQQLDMEVVSEIAEPPVEPLAPVDVIEYDVVADNVVEDDSEEIIAEYELAVEPEIVADEAPVAKLQEVQTVGGVQVTPQKRTGASQKAVLDHYAQMEKGDDNPREDTVEKEENIFITVESMPEFPGGEEAFSKYLADSLHYPQAALEQKIHGRVFVTFIVEKDGSISDARILRGIGGGCDEEALRVVQNMPNWIPGKQRGKPVRVQYNLPIMFTLGEK